MSGRTYPVEIRYHDPEEREDDNDQTDAIVRAVDELKREAPGDILVFLSGERDIRDTQDALQKQQYRNTEIVPLYARLSAAEQNRIFQSHSGQRIVLATNVAETSLTVPGIKYVIDPGTARISRYSARSKVQRLPIEPISQASANQRKGRCGRVSEGICYRLYDEDDFKASEVAERLKLQLKKLELIRLLSDQLLKKKRLGLDIYMRGMSHGVRLSTKSNYSVTLFELLKSYSNHVMRKNFLSINILKLPVCTTERGISIIKANMKKIEPTRLRCWLIILIATSTCLTILLIISLLLRVT